MRPFTLREHLDKKTPPDQRRQQPSKVLASDAGIPSFHIIIPVDIQAFNHPLNMSNTLDEGLYTQLMDYNLGQSIQKPTTDDEQNNSVKFTNKPSLFNHRFPIYGKATAGPKGKVVFEVSEDANGITEDNQVEFFGRVYETYSTKRKDTKITIVDGKTYGWLKINGKSMNNAIPIPIDDQDYVLFTTINDLESCKNKIVIATQPGPDEQHPRLIVKRLKLGKEGNISKKYYLKS